jgi:hypothetical protein
MKLRASNPVYITTFQQCAVMPAQVATKAQVRMLDYTGAVEIQGNPPRG